MFFTFRILFYTILDSDLSASKILSIHLPYSNICTLKAIKTDKSVSFALAIFHISRDFSVDDHAKVAESFIKHFFIDFF